MFDALLSRLFKRSPSPLTTRAPVAPAIATVNREAADRRATPAAAAPAGVGARRPLVSASGALAGFEFHADPMALTRLRRRDDETAAVAYAANVLGAMRLCAGQQLVALAAVPPSWLARCVRDDMFAPGMHLVLQPDPLFDDPAAVGDLVDRLRKTGVRVGWHPAVQPGDRVPAGRPDFIALRAPKAQDAAAWRAAIASSATAWRGVPQVLLDLPGVDVMEAVLAPPVVLAGCTIGSCVVPARVQSLPPQAHRLLRLLNRLLHDDDNTGVVADIKADAALCLRLLHYLNSAGATPGRELDSIEQAVLVLGRDKLYRWIAQMLVRMAPPRPAAEALQSLALARARMLEQLARVEGTQSPGSLYLLGLASMLPLLLQCSIEVAGDALCLSPAAMQALQQRAGPWAPYLLLLEALEANDISGAEALATPFGGLDAVFSLWTEAWRPR